MIADAVGKGRAEMAMQKPRKREFLLSLVLTQNEFWHKDCYMVVTVLSAGCHVVQNSVEISISIILAVPITFIVSFIFPIFLFPFSIFFLAIYDGRLMLESRKSI